MFMSRFTVDMVSDDYVLSQFEGVYKTFPKQRLSSYNAGKQYDLEVQQNMICS